MEKHVAEIRSRTEPGLKRDVAIIAASADAVEAEMERCGGTERHMVHRILNSLLDGIRALDEKLNGDTSRENVPADKE